MDVAADFFAYGTLMFEDIMSSVSGCGCKCEPALLHDYRRYRVRNAVYPGIVPESGGVVRGTVYFNLAESAWQRLDLFEGEMYRRQTVEVKFADRRTQRAQTYIVRPEFTSRLSRREWSSDEFLREGKSRFLARYRGFERLKPAKGL